MCSQTRSLLYYWGHYGVLFLQESITMVNATTKGYLKQYENNLVSYILYLKLKRNNISNRGHSAIPLCQLRLFSQ